MYRKYMFRAALMAKNIKIKDLQHYLGVSAPTMSRKIKNGSFTREELEKIRTLLNISDLRPIFFYDGEEKDEFSA